MMPSRPRSRAALTPPGMVPWAGSVEDEGMTQHNIKILNHPDPLAEELFVHKRVRAHELARQWRETAIASGLNGLLYPGDRAGCQDLIRRARARQLLCSDVCDDVAWLAETCAKRIATLTDYDAPATRSKTAMLHDNSQALYALAAVIDEVLDLDEALRARHRIMTQS